jgi:hypothetical protein
MADDDSDGVSFVDRKRGVDLPLGHPPPERGHAPAKKQAEPPPPPKKTPGTENIGRPKPEQ